ncbi:MaoC family dehydratase [Aurantimonas sp. Leaf443]|uniref:MaoC family dehydratase n=1 Tax=Aurantimonas sp. Leaf443 TaxID=1736378 RepID=UPI00070077CA|nr:MaoC family dehydratase [Aurantimonas sp. Leaf443]KQT82522.1 dehydratase [Aurantimonas sp. Leaf443]
MIYWDSIEVGREFALGTHLFTKEAILRFAAAYDPQPFHLDEDRARASLLGGLCASGWHTAAVGMRLNIETRHAALKALAEAGHPVPALGPSPGVRNLRWPRPVFAGDTIAYFMTVTEKRLSKSRPGLGIIESTTRAQNQDGEPVFGFEASVFQPLG